MADDAGGAVGKSPAVQVVESQEKFSLLRSVVYVIGFCGAIAATYIPLHAIEPSVEALAGKNTSVSAVFSITIAVSVTLAITLAGAGWKIRGQSKELKRMRQRINVLEQELSSKEQGSQG